MRLYLISIFLLILMIALGIVNIYALDASTKEIASNFDDIYNSINNNDWHSAEKEITRSKELWDKHKKWWTVILDHYEIHTIDMSFTKIQEYIKSHDVSLSSVELQVLQYTLEHIPKKEMVNLKNIL